MKIKVYEVVGFGVMACFFAVVFSVICGYGFSEKNEEVLITDSVDVVFYHEIDHYSFILSRKDSLSLVIKDFRGSNASISYGGVKVSTDALPNKKAFIKRLVGYNLLFWSKDHYDKLIEIHIHSAKDLKPADWDHGKFGSGKTTVIE